MFVSPPEPPARCITCNTSVMSDEMTVQEAVYDSDVGENSSSQHSSSSEDTTGPQQQLAILTQQLSQPKELGKRCFASVRAISLPPVSFAFEDLLCTIYRLKVVVLRISCDENRQQKRFPRNHRHTHQLRSCECYSESFPGSVSFRRTLSTPHSFLVAFESTVPPC